MKTVMFINRNASYIVGLDELHSFNNTIYDTLDNELYESNTIYEECISLLNILHQKLSRNDYASALITNNELYFYKYVPGELAVVKWVYNKEEKRWDTFYDDK